jgi:hypothetical protein
MTSRTLDVSRELVSSMPKKFAVSTEDEERPAVAVKSFMNTNRKCRDIPFLVLFLVFWAGMVIVAINATKQGDPRRLVYIQLNAVSHKILWATFVGTITRTNRHLLPFNRFKTVQRPHFSTTLILFVSGD